ncbi:MAG: exopolysaccharide biosynthesis polyprenyl glycosylphosphotransferase [Parasphingorhabdus sp.]|nr:exopolysaccharide biosynthesis polyprenyl glycosylphosphotransferase [Parasphingorhabdus sp.]
MTKSNTLTPSEKKTRDVFLVNEFTSPKPGSGNRKPLSLAHLHKKKSRRKLLMVGLVIGDIAAIVLAFSFASLIWLNFIDLDQLGPIFVAVIPIYLAASLENKGFNVKVLNDLSTGIQRVIRAILFASISMLLIMFFFKSSVLFSRALFALGTIGSIGLLSCNRLIFKRISQNVLGNTQFADLCIYDGVAFGQQTGENAIQAADHEINANKRDLSTVHRLGQLVTDLDRVIVHCSADKRDSWIFLLRSIDIKSEIVIPELDAIKPLEIRQRGGSTSLLVSAGHLRWDQQILKRIFDLGFVLLTLPLVLPILIIVSILIKLDSRGPVFFVQRRIGLGNRPFKIWKFRSMSIDSLDEKGEISTSRDDKRVTTVGKFIRRTSIDELPQLFNILKGDMSVVGPRPHATGSRAENSLFWDIDDRYWHRHIVKPGLTGLAQIRGYRGATEKRSDLSNRLQSDLEYAARWSLFWDIRILFKTIAVIFHVNAY